VLALAATLAMPFQPACVPAVARNLGVTPSPSGTARLVFVHCGDRGVTGVSLSRDTAVARVPDPLWRIEARQPSPASVFTVGRTPLGFREAVPLRRPLPPFRRVFAQVETTQGRYAMGFRALDLTPGLVLRAADAVPKAAFASEACP
jgi:hypothetical protein